MTSSAPSDRSPSGAPALRASRRAFLRGSLAGVAGTIAAPSIFDALVARGELGLDGSRAYAQMGNGGYGPLAPTPDQRDNVARISLPAGFQYVTFGAAGTRLADGNLTPLAHDGMASFALRNGNVLLIRNHEDRNAPGAGSTGGNPAHKYDPSAAVARLRWRSIPGRANWCGTSSASTAPR
jgi:secreted PhoX family phosphatase